MSTLGVPSLEIPIARRVDPRGAMGVGQLLLREMGQLLLQGREDAPEKGHPEADVVRLNL